MRPHVVRNLCTLASFGMALAIPFGVHAQEAEPHPAAEYRQSLMQGLRSHTGALRALLGGDVTYEGHVVHHAEAVQGIATMALNAFPEATGGEGSRAMDAIWENWDDFLTKARALKDGADALAAAASSGDMAAVDEAMSAVGGSCRGCHTDYRAPANE
ncbi:MAG: cytochrome c [Gemmatimonadetes bacterium]|nr:cytochrome c [Gemmatimonadota bacterium]